MYIKRRLSLIVQVNVVLNRAVVVDSDWCFDWRFNLCGSHLQSQSELCHISWWYYALVIDLWLVNYISMLLQQKYNWILTVVRSLRLRRISEFYVLVVILENQILDPLMVVLILIPRLVIPDPSAVIADPTPIFCFWSLIPYTSLRTWMDVFLLFPISVWCLHAINNGKNNLGSLKLWCMSFHFA